MANRVTYRNLFQLVNEQIEKSVTYNSKSPYAHQLSRTSVSPLSGSSRSDASTAELVTAIQNLLSDALPSWIISGLTVEATTPISAQVTVTAGKGAASGVLYELLEDTTLTIPFDDSTSLFYITLYKDNIYIDKTLSPNKLTIAKIIVPEPGTTVYVQNNKDEFWNAYIVNFKEYKLYGYNDKFEEDTIELLRDNISPILADNLIGNIRLDEDLKIINTAGTLELNSDSLKLYDLSENLLAKFDRRGVFLYDEDGIELAKFTGTEARVGNIKVLTNAIQSGNFVSGGIGFRIRDDGNVEFNDALFRGTIYAAYGTIGGWTIDSSSLYATTTGTIKTSATVASGSDGVILDKDGLRVYDDVLGLVVNLPSDGSAPVFSSGSITETTFEISTNAVLRTSSTVGDGSVNSAGILINNTGIYGCEISQTLADANLKALIDGTVRLKGEIIATLGQIGSVTITSTKLTGGLIEGANIISPIIETSSTPPKMRIDSTGISYQVTTTVGKYGSSDSGFLGFMYGDGTKYGSGLAAALFTSDLPFFSVLAEQDEADIRLYNRTSDPLAGTHILGDFICVNNRLKRCTVAGSPGTFSFLDTFLSLSDTPSSFSGAGSYFVKVDSGATALEFVSAIPKYIYLVVPEPVLVVETNKIGRIYVDFSGTITEVFASVITAPTGANIICDINLNGTTIWSTQGNRITIATTEFTATQTTFNTTAVVAGDYFTLDLDQVGSTVAGTKLVIRIKIEE